MKPVLVLYHANCRDGFGAALAAWYEFGDERADYVPVQYGGALPDCTGREAVYVLDFSFTRADLLDLARQCGRLTVIDHHASAERALSGIEGEAENLHCTFDMGHSGAVLAWQHFHTGPAPLLLQYVQDRDLWTKTLPMSEEVALGLGCVPSEFSAWHAIVCEEHDGIASLAQAGSAIRTYLDAQLATLARNAPRAQLFGYDVPVVNAPGFLASDLGNLLAHREPFAATWFVAGGKVVVSLRSSADGLDVSELAEMAGGGGHRHAAGFSVPFDRHALADLGVADVAEEGVDA